MPRPYLTLSPAAAPLAFAPSQVYGNSEELVHTTLLLFQDLGNGYMSGRLLLKLDAISYLLNHHTAEFYGFLDHTSNTRNRSEVLCALSPALRPGWSQAWKAPGPTLECPMLDPFQPWKAQGLAPPKLTTIAKKHEVARDDCYP